MMGGFGMVEGDELFEKSSSVRSEVGKWSGGLPLSRVGGLTMIARFVKSRVLSISALISAICWNNCAINLFCSTMMGSFTVISVKFVFSTFSTTFSLPFDKYWSEKESLGSLDLVKYGCSAIFLNTDQF